MDLIEEYKEFSGLPKHIAVVYKFFSLFSFSDNKIYWSKTGFEIGEEEYGAFKAYVKHCKRVLREGGLSAGPSECSKMMLFLYMKIQEFSIFNIEIRKEIMKYMEVCELVIC